MTKTDEELDEYHRNLLEALQDCRTYARLGGLDRNVMADIAFERGLTYDQLKEEWAEPGRNPFDV